MAEPDHESDEALQARLGKLSAALEAQQKEAQAHDPGPQVMDQAGQSVGSAMSLGFRVLSEFVAAIVVGALIGWQLDNWIGTAPILLILFLVLGTAAGFWNIYRIAVKPPGSRGGLS